VAIRAEQQERGGAVILEVTDDGPGIPADEAARVFERFHRLDPARAADDGGSGLGLAIARWIVDLHGGSIRVASEDQPRGCRMVVTLPGGAA
jgi:signal transduction histidine kinase